MLWQQYQPYQQQQHHHCLSCTAPPACSSHDLGSTAENESTKERKRPPVKPEAQAQARPIQRASPNQPGHFRRWNPTSPSPPSRSSSCSCSARAAMAAGANHGIASGRATRPGWLRLLHSVQVAGSGLIQVHPTITTRRSPRLPLNRIPRSRTKTGTPTRTRTTAAATAMTASSDTPPLKGPASPSSPNSSPSPSHSHSHSHSHPSPLHRPASPYSDPRQLGPRSQILATRTSNYHSTSLRNSKLSCALSLISPHLFLARERKKQVKQNKQN